MQSEAACKVAEEGKLEQEKSKDEAANAYSKMDEPLHKVMAPDNNGYHFGWDSLNLGGMRLMLGMCVATCPWETDACKL